MAFHIATHNSSCLPLDFSERGVFTLIPGRQEFKYGIGSEVLPDGGSGSNTIDSAVDNWDAAYWSQLHAHVNAAALPLNYSTAAAPAHGRVALIVTGLLRFRDETHLTRFSAACQGKKITHVRHIYHFMF